MKPLLAFSRYVDGINAVFGKAADWLILFACVISAGNAFVRYGVRYSSNAWLEVQWYLFAGVVMLGAAPHAAAQRARAGRSRLRRLRERGAALGGHLRHHLLPAAGHGAPDLDDLAVLPRRLDASGRQSSNAGGLIRWPVKILLPLGFVLLTLQGLSELIKRVALLRGIRPTAQIVLDYEKPVQ